MEHKNRGNTVNALCKDIEVKVSLCLQEAMACTQPLRFGDKKTADVRLYLIDSAGVQHPGNPLFLHSHVLKKAEFFEIKLSQSWSSAKRPFEIQVTCSHHPQSYIKCIKLMYSYDTDECFDFTRVDEALAILPVASEVMFRDCMESCMRYLDAVRWNPEQKAKLRVLLSSLNITVLPDLAARLGMSQSKSESERIKILKESVQDWLQMTYRSQNRGIVEKRIFNYFKLNTSPAIKDACRDAILNRFKEDMEAFKSNKSDETSMQRASCHLSWLVGVIRKCDAKLFATVVKEFCEDADLRNAVADGVAARYLHTANNMLTILNDQILEAMGNGKIITSMSFRVDFLTNWTDTMVKLFDSDDEFIGALEPYIYTEIEDFLPSVEQKRLSILESRIIDVGETLPLVEQKRIYSVCQEIFIKNSIDSSGLCTWWAQKLEDAIILHKDLI